MKHKKKQIINNRFKKHNGKNMKLSWKNFIVMQQQQKKILFNLQSQIQLRLAYKLLL